MNTNVAAIILLIISIVLQSFVATSATMEVHQSNVEHLQTVHDHESDHLTFNVHSLEQNTNDCHHCEHCNGNHLSWISFTTFSTNLSLNNSQDFNKLVLSPLGISNRVYHPPNSFTFILKCAYLRKHTLV